MPSRARRLPQASPRSKPLPIYGTCSNHGDYWCLHPSGLPVPRRRDDQGCPHRNLQGWYLLHPRLHPCTTSASPLWSSPPKPAGSLYLVPTPIRPAYHATLRQIVFTSAPSPKVEVSPQRQAPIPLTCLPTHEPISHRIRARAPALTPLALFTTGRPLHERVTY